MQHIQRQKTAFAHSAHANPRASQQSAENDTQRCSKMSEKVRMLVVDADPRVRQSVLASLANRRYELLGARTGGEAIDRVRSESFDLILLAIDLPDMSVVDVCREIRAGFDTVIVILTSHGDAKDNVAALDAGADDYIRKPFVASELSARVRAHLRRSKRTAKPSANSFVSEGLAIDFATRAVTRQGRKIRLSPKQAQVLRLLVSNRGKTLSSHTIMRTIWGIAYGDRTALLQALIVQLRKKVEPKPTRPQYIVTVPWVGYRFDSGE